MGEISTSCPEGGAANEVGAPYPYLRMFFSW